ncbi:hypothetical protein [Streptomyces sp. RerS4]|uniref:AraC-like ligand-binding domain-containing protein n=1 Tax=Streptomyces sp. RerS4 TaxID=2942449 RepID=UPI00201C46DF|nr:hypothetical protein [Streptomyces sp. RerS4]UQW99631.1 hypothetical protein M4D82_03085 [Streptomyces sp. RerS4]
MSLTLAPARTSALGTLGFLRVSTLRGAAHSRVHEPGDAAAEPHLVLGLRTSGRATLVRRGTVEPCDAGDLFVSDAAEPFALHASEDFELHLVRIPRRVLALTDGQVQALAHRAPFAGGAVAPLLVPLLRALVDTLPGWCAPRTGLHLACSVAELVTLLAVEHVAGRAEQTASGEPGGERATSKPELRVEKQSNSAICHRSTRAWMPVSGSSWKTSLGTDASVNAWWNASARSRGVTVLRSSGSTQASIVGCRDVRRSVIAQQRHEHVTSMVPASGAPERALTVTRHCTHGHGGRPSRA